MPWSHVHPNLDVLRRHGEITRDGKNGRWRLTKKRPVRDAGFVGLLGQLKKAINAGDETRADVLERRIDGLVDSW